MNTTISAPLTRDQIVRCAAAGDITTTTEKSFAELLERTLAAARDNWLMLEIDLRNARLIDSKGLNLLVSTIKSLRGQNRRVRLVAPQASVRRILAFTRIDQHAEVVGPDGQPT